MVLQNVWYKRYYLSWIVKILFKICAKQKIIHFQIIYYYNSIITITNKILVDCLSKNYDICFNVNFCHKQK